MLVVHRSIEGNKGGERGFPGAWLPTFTSIDIPDAAKGTQPPTWKGSLIPVLLDYDVAQDTWYLLAAVPTCQEWEKQGRPEPPYVEYLARRGQPWVKTELEERWIGQKANLISSPERDEPERLIPLHEKEYLSLNIFEIYRSIIPRWDMSC